MKNLGAHTASGSNYPPFVSVNAVDGHVEITVRNHPRDGMCGDTATICLSSESYFDFLSQLKQSEK